MPPRYQEGLERNARLRIEGARNLVGAARAANVKRMVAQSIAFIYAPGAGARVESDPLNGDRAVARTVEGVKALEESVLALPEGIVLRYGYLYGPGTWFEAPAKPPSLYIDAAAQATVLALARGRHGLYNIAEDDGAVSSEKAKRELGFAAGFRL